ncbi:MAG: hypothetical protein ACI30D_07180 [Muribaculaceae bacterium]
MCYSKNKLYFSHHTGGIHPLNVVGAQAVKHAGVLSPTFATAKLAIFSVITKYLISQKFRREWRRYSQLAGSGDRWFFDITWELINFVTNANSKITYNYDGWLSEKDR